MLGTTRKAVNQRGSSASQSSQPSAFGTGSGVTSSIDHLNSQESSFCPSGKPIYLPYYIVTFISRSPSNHMELPEEWIKFTYELHVRQWVWQALESIAVELKLILHTSYFSTLSDTKWKRNEEYGGWGSSNQHVQINKFTKICAKDGGKNNLFEDTIKTFKIF
jgi:hypothetical protein